MSFFEGDGHLFHTATGGNEWHLVAAPNDAVLCLGGNESALYAGLYGQGLLCSQDGGQSWRNVAGFAGRAITRLHSNGENLFAFGLIMKKGACFGCWLKADITFAAAMLRIAAPSCATGQ